MIIVKYVTINGALTGAYFFLYYIFIEYANVHYVNANAILM